jgi:hypothetical protein
LHFGHWNIHVQYLFRASYFIYIGLGEGILSFLNDRIPQF